MAFAFCPIVHPVAWGLSEVLLRHIVVAQSSPVNEVMLPALGLVIIS